MIICPGKKSPRALLSIRTSGNSHTVLHWSLLRCPVTQPIWFLQVIASLTASLACMGYRQLDQLKNPEFKVQFPVLYLAMISEILSSPQDFAWRKNERRRTKSFSFLILVKGITSLNTCLGRYFPILLSRAPTNDFNGVPT